MARNVVTVNQINNKTQKNTNQPHLVKHSCRELTAARVVLVLEYERHELGARKNSGALSSDRGEDLLPLEGRSEYAHLHLAMGLEELAQLAVKQNTRNAVCARGGREGGSGGRGGREAGKQGSREAG